MHSSRSNLMQRQHFNLKFGKGPSAVQSATPRACEPNTISSKLYEGFRDPRYSLWARGYIPARAHTYACYIARNNKPGSPHFICAFRLLGTRPTLQSRDLCRIPPSTPVPLLGWACQAQARQSLWHLRDPKSSRLIGTSSK